MVWKRRRRISGLETSMVLIRLTPSAMKQNSDEFLRRSHLEKDCLSK